MKQVSNESLIEEIKKRLNIVDLIETFVSLKRAGKDYVGLCPFHDDKNPSMHVSQDKGLFHCFSCGEGGDIFGFLMKYNNISFKEALEELAKKANVKITKSINTGKSSKKKLLYKINSLALSYFHNNLIKEKSSENARNYLKTRGIDSKIAKEFKLGFANDSWDGLLKFLSSKKIPADLALELGLIINRSDRSGHYDRFRNRIIFPIINISGEVIGFGGRVISEEDKPKYMNSPESAIYKKRDSFYGLYNSKDEIRKKDQAILVEGYMDLISLYKSGLKNVVATLGTSFTKDHAVLLKKYSDNVVILYDGDGSGLSSSLRAGEIFLEQGLMPKIVSLPEENDPDSYIEKFGLEKLDSLIEESKLLPDYFLEKTALDLKNKKLSRNKTSETIMNFLLKISNNVDRSHYISKASNIFGFRESDLYALANSERNKYKVDNKIHDDSDINNSFEYLILKIILNFPDTIKYLVGQKFLYLVDDSDIKRILVEIVDNGFSDIDSFINRFNESSIQTVISKAVFSFDGINDESTAIKMLKECIARLKLKHIGEELRSIRTQIQELSKDIEPDKEKKLLQDYNNLVKEEKEIKEELYEI